MGNRHQAEEGVISDLRDEQAEGMMEQLDSELGSAGGAQPSRGAGGQESMGHQPANQDVPGSIASESGGDKDQFVRSALAEYIKMGGSQQEFIQELQKL